MANNKLSQDKDKQLASKEVKVVSTCTWVEEIRSILSSQQEIKGSLEELKEAVKELKEAVKELKEKTGEKESEKTEPVDLDSFLTENSELLFKAEKPGLTVIHPRKFLGEKWREINSELRKHGFKWVSEGKLSRWERRREPHE